MDAQHPLPSYPAGAQFSTPPQAIEYPFPPPVYCSVSLPGYAEQLNTLWQNLHTAEIDKEKLRYQLQQKHLAEEAYTHVLKVADNCLCTQSKYGVWVPILNRTIRMAARLEPEPPLRGSAVYAVLLSQEKQPVILSEKQFYHDAMLISKLQEASGAEVTVRKSPKATAILLRQAISRDMAVFPVSLYAGWSAHAENGFCFTAFSPFSSHLGTSAMDSPPLTGPQLLSPMPEGMRETAVKNWSTAFAPIQDPFARWLLNIWFHTAGLTSLLDGLHFGPPLGLYLFCDNPAWLAYLHRLFCWFGDPPLKLDSPSAKFPDELLARKDQPLVIDDGNRTRQAAANADTLETMLASRELPWKNGRNSQYLPVRALPVVLASAASGLACNPYLISLDLSSEDLEGQCSPRAFPSEAYLNEYLQAFFAYTSTHIAELHSLLQKAHGDAMELAGNALSEPFMNTLGLALGIHCFLAEFYKPAGGSGILDVFPIEDFASRLVDLLHETSDKQFSGLADQFVLIARAMIRQRQLVLYMRDSQKKVSEGTPAVYLDADSLYFTSAALRAICERLKQSRPVILRALAEAGYIQGHAANETTVMTRIQLWNVYGVPEAVYVYRLQRDAFELLGDPLPEGVDAL